MVIFRSSQTYKHETSETTIGNMSFTFHAAQFKSIEIVLSLLGFQRFTTTASKEFI